MFAWKSKPMVKNVKSKWMKIDVALTWSANLIDGIVNVPLMIDCLSKLLALLHHGVVEHIDVEQWFF